MLLGGVEIDVLAAVGRVGPGDTGVRALATQAGLHADVPAGRAEPERHPVETTVAPHLGALGAEDPAALRQRLPADVAKPGVITDDQLDHGVEHALDVFGA